MICGREGLRGLCFVVVARDLTTEFWEVEGARGWWERRRVEDVVDVTLLATEAVRFRGFSGTSEVLRLVVVRGAICHERRKIKKATQRRDEMGYLDGGCLVW